jgi:glutamine cyclotransferase
MKHLLFALSFAVVFAGCKNGNKDEANAETVPSPSVLNYTITNVYPHDTSSFTEGLEWHDGFLYESTGNTGRGKLAKIDLATGKDVQRVSLAKEVFGEGITVLNGKIYQLTYHNGKCFVYDFTTFKKLSEFTYTGEGWGMTNDGKNLIMNNSGTNLYYLDPQTFQVVKTVTVVDNNGPVSSINELEYVDGYIYSNVWITNSVLMNYILKIDPKTGHVVSKADFSNVIDKYAPGQLTQEAIDNGAALNGIAYDNVGKRFFVTGKLWPKIFEVKFN